ncbi:myrosinase 1-like [Trichoplusia ni]|uniref:Myrosinase 1-like n=1 Tax=Trichoplusia ni TaxID=7111 RepID=A0A7E5VA09_TRINI|nr:myrosinase 1-like [Trichoplusia ni]
MKLAVLLCSALAVCHGAEVKQSRKFPNYFVFGVGTAAYQIEGAWNEDGKGENIWDYLTHTNPSAIVDQSNGDIACDSYHNYKRDIEMLRELGVSVYRFSVSWSRILPEGLSYYINEAGITYYNNLIDELLKYNIQPMITIYHWDLPQRLQELGGFMNPLIADWFEDYARIVFKTFGDRVKFFATFNEPSEICSGYGSLGKAPMLNETGFGDYLCARNLLLAHAKAYHLYNDEFRPTQGGVIGFILAVSSTEPLTDSEEDKFAVELYSQATWGIYTDPIYSKEGGFPKELVERVAAKSAAQGYSRSRLPDFSEEEKAFILGTSDFFGVNHYSGSYVSQTLYTSQHAIPSALDDIEMGTYAPDEWLQSASSWFQLMPNSVHIFLKLINARYPGVRIYITENGWSSREGIVDEDRVNYYRSALEGVLDALDEGINVHGYLAWSLMDNFEWMAGYSERFGLYEVDFNDPNRTRTPRKSAFIYKNIMKTRMVDHDYEPESYVMTIDEGH